MKLAELLAIYKQYKMGSDPLQDVVGIETDHRRVSAGHVFVAIRGTNFDGHSCLKEAVERGAPALIVQDTTQIPKSFHGAVVQVPDTRQAAGDLACRFYGEPASQLFCVGVTGTNGKTSTTYLIESVLNEFGMLTGVMGTVNHHVGSTVWESSLTTPDPITLQKRLSEFVALGAKAAAFEVSSHALDQGRADPIAFDAAVFTNLTRDHLDYHKTMDAYFQAKNKLFRDLLGRKKDRAYAIVNDHDEWSKKLDLPSHVQRWGYGEGQTDFQFQLLKTDFTGTHFRLHTPRGKIEIHSPLIGRHNVFNTTAAIAVGLAAGASLEIAKKGVEKFMGVPGRLERVPSAKGPHVFVDYAHTDDALKTVLTALHEVRKQGQSHAKIITVFGCGGDRDKGKRPLMAAAAIEHSDVVFVTSDNPRSEDPIAIIQDILSGAPKDLMNRKIFVEVDRREAIRKAIDKAGVKDVVLIAGKGHENYQIVGDKKFDFSDVMVAKEYIGGL